MLTERLINWFGEDPENSKYRAADHVGDDFCLNTNIGLKRNENQDRTAALYVNLGGVSKSSFYCFVLCDGMGGMADGSVAATLAISSFLESLILLRNEPPENRLRQSAFCSNSVVKDAVAGGSTMSAVLFSDRTVFSLNVGDSRIYSKSKDGKINRHTRDDNLKEVAGGEDERLLQYIGMGDGLRPHIQRIRENFDLVFLTSDGVHSLEQDVFNKIVLHSNTTDQLCERLVSTSVWAGGHDNASVIGVSGTLAKKKNHPGNGPEIAVWNNKYEMQIAWTNSMSQRTFKEENARSNNQKLNALDGKVGEVELIEDDKLEIESSRKNRKPSSKKWKTRDRAESKFTFGDFG